MATPQIPTTKLFNIPLYTGSPAELTSLVLDHLKAKKRGKPLVIFTPNAEHTIIAQSHKSFAKALEEADINVPDSMGMVWAHQIVSAAHRLPTKLYDRITGIDLMQKLAIKALKRGKKVFLLGSRGSVASDAARTLIRLTRDQDASLEADDLRLLIESSSGAPRIGFETPAEYQATRDQITKHKTDILFVAYGAPEQELWAIRHAEDLGEAGVRVIMVTGGSFDVLAGRLARAPKRLQNAGLEWLWRLIQEPSRWRRQLRLVNFMGLTLREAIFR